MTHPTPEPGGQYVSRDGTTQRVHVVAVTPDHVSVEWHDGWGKRHTADLTHGQFAVAFRPFAPAIHTRPAYAPTELGATTAPANETPGSVGTSALDLDVYAVRARHERADMLVRSGGYQPWRNPVDASAADVPTLLAAVEQQAARIEFLAAERDRLLEKGVRREARIFRLRQAISNIGDAWVIAIAAVDAHTGQQHAADARSIVDALLAEADQPDAPVSDRLGAAVIHATTTETDQ